MLFVAIVASAKPRFTFIFKGRAMINLQLNRRVLKSGIEDDLIKWARRFYDKHPPFVTLIRGKHDILHLFLHQNKMPILISAFKNIFIRPERLQNR